MVKNIFSLLKS